MKKFNAPIILASVLFLLLAGWSILNRDTPSIHAENGIMENIQLALLFLASVVYFTAFFNGKGTPRLIPLFLSALSLLFIFRELDFESFTDNHLIIMFGNGIGRNIIMTAMLSGILLMALFKHKTYIPGSLKFVKSKAGISLITGGILIIIAEVCEGLTKSGVLANGQFYEEFFEMCGYYMMLLSAYFCTQYFHKKK